MRIDLCGVRGSTPAPGPEFVRYGGHTSCVALSRDGDPGPTLLLDAGTGVRRVTGLLGGGPFLGAVLLTHLHWDHVQGLPFFGAGDRPDARVHLLLPSQEDGRGAEEVLADMMSPPHFPIRPGQLRGEWTFANLCPGTLAALPGAPGFTVEAHPVDHKGGRTYGYRVSDGRSVVTYIPDHCPTAAGPGPEGWGEYGDDVLGLAEGADLLIHDAHLLVDELAAEASFGHAAADYAVELGHRAGAARVVLFHHKPDRTDAELDRLADRFHHAPVAVIVAREESVVEL